MARPWTVEKSDKTVTTIRCPMTTNSDWEQWCLVTADRHLDHPKSDRKFQRYHLDLAQKRNAFVIDLGDLFCAMQSKKDPRHAKDDIRPEDLTGDYFGSLKRHAKAFFDPYRDNLAVFGAGNHETKILKHSEIDLTRALVESLRDRGSQAVYGGYRGWVRVLFKKKNSKASYPYRLAFSHGSGGAPVVTKGAISNNRRAVYLANADGVASGHIHEAGVQFYRKVRCNSNGKEVVWNQSHFTIPTYKDEFSGQNGGHHHEKESPPKPIGAMWLRFSWSSYKKRIEADPLFDLL